jgi:predicted Rossmann fold flavoprotein
LLAEVIGETSSGGGSRSSHVISCGHVVLASGGSSYPNSGTTGDGWAWVKELGHRVVKIRAALAPIYLESPNTEFSGIALRGCTLKARQNGKEVARWTGDVLFTHQGVSGPDALGISRLVAEKLEDGEVSLEVDIVPDRSQEQLSEDLLRWAGGNPRRQLVGFVQDLAPDRLAGSLLASASIVPDLTAARLDKKSRNRLSTILKGWPIGRVRHVPLELGEVAAGGVSLDEVDAQTMESRRCHGLYLCGEVLDVAGPVGGYNLQAAFATGWLAGESAATSL